MWCEWEGGIPVNTVTGPARNKLVLSLPSFSLSLSLSLPLPIPWTDLVNFLPSSAVQLTASPSMPAREKIKANCWGSSWPVDTRGRSRKRRMRRRRSRRTRWRWRRRRWPWSRVCAGSGFCPGLGLAWRGPAAEPTSDSSSPQFLPGGQPGRLLVSLSNIARAVSPLWGMDQCCDHTCHVSRVLHVYIMVEVVSIVTLITRPDR